MESQDLNVWIPAITGLLGAFVGAVSSFIPNLITESVRRKREATSLRESLIAEIAAMTEIAEMRGYRQGLCKVCAHLENQPEGATYPFAVGIPEHYSRIYQANADRIGMIDSDSAKDIVTFHHLVDAVVQDVREGGALAAGADLEGFREALNILDRAFKIAEKLCN